MNTMFAAAVGSILRHLLTGAAALLVSRGIWSDAEAATYVSAAAIALVGILWSLWEKHQSRFFLAAALNAPAGTTKEELKEQV
jgi:uncharacterized membrane protein YjjB (DUF3815 family)